MTRIRRERADTRGRIRTHASILVYRPMYNECFLKRTFHTYTTSPLHTRVRKLTRTPCQQPTTTRKRREHPDTRRHIHADDPNLLFTYFLYFAYFRYEDINNKYRKRREKKENTKVFHASFQPACMRGIIRDTSRMVSSRLYGTI